jgi:cob(I)alamin adenosyltransferase
MEITMDKGYIQVFCGDGDGKSSAAFGKGLLEASRGKNVIIIKFMKNKDENEMEFFSKLEPEIKLFRFERSEIGFCELSEEQKAEESMNIKNGLNYANKVLGTGECDVLVLDEILGVLDEGIIQSQEIKSILESKSEDVSIIMTGINLPDELRTCVDIVSNISNES